MHSFCAWWHHQMQTFPRCWPFVRESTVTGEFPAQMPVTRSFDVFFDLCWNKRLSEQSRRRWFETPLLPLWRHCNCFDAFHCRYISTVLTTVACYRYATPFLFNVATVVLFLSNRGGERRWPQNKTGVGHRYQATVVLTYPCTLVAEY